MGVSDMSLVQPVKPASGHGPSEGSGFDGSQAGGGISVDPRVGSQGQGTDPSGRRVAQASGAATR